MVPYWKAVVMMVTVTVAEPDSGQFNHLLRMHGSSGKEFHGSYTGAKKLGEEGETIKVLLEDVECEEGFSVAESIYVGPKGYRAWICNIDKAKRLP